SQQQRGFVAARSRSLCAMSRSSTATLRKRLTSNVATTDLSSARGRSETGAVCGGSSARKRSASRLPNRDGFTVLRRTMADLEGADDSSAAAVRRAMERRAVASMASRPLSRARDHRATKGTRTVGSLRRRYEPELLVECLFDQRCPRLLTSRPEMDA